MLISCLAVKSKAVFLMHWKLHQQLQELSQKLQVLFLVQLQTGQQNAIYFHSNILLK